MKRQEKLVEKGNKKKNYNFQKEKKRKKGNNAEERWRGGKKHKMKDEDR